MSTSNTSNSHQNQSAVQSTNARNPNTTDNTNKRINNDNLKRIMQLTPQSTNNPLKDAFYNGAKFREQNELDFLENLFLQGQDQDQP